MGRTTDDRGFLSRGTSAQLATLLAVAMLAAAGPFVAAAQGSKPADKDRLPPDATQRIEVQARAIDRFQPSAGANQRFGRLVFRGGLVLTSPSADFGGISGITMSADGSRFLAVTDAGSWISGEMTYRGRAPAGLANVRLGPIRALKGRRIDKPRDLDAEALTQLDGNLARGTVLIGFERNHRIGVFPVVDGALQAPTRYLKMPPEARRMGFNKGIEAVAMLKGGPHKGSVVAFAERFPGDASRHRGWIWVKEQPQPLTLADHRGFDITDAASTDQGALLILERRFRWTEGVKMRVRLIAPDDVKPGARLDGEILLEADMSSEIDNMEGLAVHRAGGETILTIVSDNNFNSFLQRNLLLQFTLAEPTTSSRR